jgi:hypothetical protein
MDGKERRHNLDSIEVYGPRVDGGATVYIPSEGYIDVKESAAEIDVLVASLGGATRYYFGGGVDD